MITPGSSDDNILYKDSDKNKDPRERNLMIYRRDSARISNQKKRSNKRLSGLLKDMPHA